MENKTYVACSITHYYRLYRVPFTLIFIITTTIYDVDDERYGECVVENVLPCCYRLHHLHSCNAFHDRLLACYRLSCQRSDLIASQTTTTIFTRTRVDSNHRLIFDKTSSAVHPPHRPLG